MSNIALRPRSPTELVDAAFQLYRRDPIPFITGLALIYVPWLVVSAATGLAEVLADPTALALNPGRMMWLGLGTGITYILASSITTSLANDAYFDRTVDVAKAFRLVFQRFGGIFLASLITGVSVMLGTLVFILPGIYIYCRLFATKQAILLEGSGGGASIGRSWRLSKSSVRHILNTLGLALLLNLAVGIGANVLAKMIPSQIVQQVIATIVGCLVYPIVGIIETMLYYDIRIRREGFDIEYLAAAAPISPIEQSAAT
jgi:hypothetical protein